MKNNIAILAFLAIGAIFSGLILFLGKTYISVIYGLSLGVFITVLSFIAYFLYKKSEFSKNEDYLENTVSVIESIIPEVPRKTISSVVKAYFYRHLLNIFVLIALFIAGLFASILLIKQNDIMKDQNYLICQQTQYLAVKFNPYLNPNKELYDYFERLKNNIRKLLGKSIEFKYTSSLGADIRNDKYNKNLPQKEFTQILNLRKKIIRIEKDNGVADLMQNQNYLSLVKEYKQLLKGFYDLIVNKENQMKAEEKEKTIDFNDCKKYNE